MEVESLASSSKKITTRWREDGIVVVEKNIKRRLTFNNKNSSGDEIANVNFYAVRPEATRIRWNNAK